MKTKQHRRQFTLLACLVTIQASGFASADAERDLLLKVSAEKVDAMIIASGRDWSSYGCFIGEDGLAVLNLRVFGNLEAPEKYFMISREELDPPTLRWFSAELGIAIAKFDYKPKVIIEPCAEALTLGTQLAILDPELEGPVAIGPVTQITMETPGNLLHAAYVPNFSVGAGLPGGRRVLAGTGYPIIDSQGRLRGNFAASKDLSIQILLDGVATSEWFAEIAKAKASKEKIPIPLPPDLNPYDPAAYHPDYRGALIALSRDDFDEAIKRVQIALQAHPTSPLLRSLHFDIANMGDMIDKLPALAEATKPPPGASNAELLVYHKFVAKACRGTGDQAGAGKALHKGLKIAPKEDTTIREEYAMWLGKEGKLDEALRYIREASDAAPANLVLLTRLKSLLGGMGKWDEEAKVTDRIFGLEKLYRTTSLSDLRPKKR